ncbi:SAM-dependent methyltransferase [Nocardiopsis coralliicola]
MMDEWRAPRRAHARLHAAPPPGRPEAPSPPGTAAPAGSAGGENPASTVRPLPRPRSGGPPSAPRDPAGTLRTRFAARAVRYLAADAGVRQFVDLGSGLPVCDAVLDTARRHPDLNAVYADPSCGPALSGGAARIVPVGSADAAGALAQLGASGALDCDAPAAFLLADTAPLVRADLPALLRALFAALAPGSHVALIAPSAAPPAAAPFTPLDPVADIAWWPYPDDAVAPDTRPSGLTGFLARRDGAPWGL